MARCLVTGGAGFIGSHLVDALIDLGHQVTIVDDLSTGQVDNIHSEAEFVQCSLQNLESLPKSVEYIFHLAAIPRTQYCIEHPYEAHQANVDGTINLLELARLAPTKLKKIITASSCAIYGSQATLPISEKSPINLGTTYALQKYIQELYTRNYTTLYGVPSLSLRLFNTYGTARQSQAGAYPNVLASFSEQKRMKGYLEVTGDGTQTRDMVHVYDVVKAFVAAMKSDIADGRAYNVGSGKKISINQAATFFDCRVCYIDPRPGEAKHLYADVTKIQQELNWKAQINFNEGIKIYINQLEKQEAVK